MPLLGSVPYADINRESSLAAAGYSWSTVSNSPVGTTFPSPNKNSSTENSQGRTNTECTVLVSLVTFTLSNRMGASCELFKNQFCIKTRLPVAPDAVIQS